MIDLALHRSRVATPATEPDTRRALGQRLLTQLGSLGERVEALLPELAALRRLRAPPRAVTLYVGWAVEHAGAPGPRFTVSLEAAVMRVRWGYGREGRRGRFVAEGIRRRRALGDALLDRLHVLRAAGAALYLARDGGSVAEADWAQGVGGSVEFAWNLPAAEGAEALARRVAEALGRLAGLARALGALPDMNPPRQIVRTPHELAEGVRALRWEERAQGASRPPAGVIPFGRSYAYDPVSGWFAPAAFAASQGCSLGALQLGPAWAEAPPEGAYVKATRESGLSARLARWLAARGVRDPELASGAVIHVAATRAPRLDEPPVLELLLSAGLGDPSGDVAVALAALLHGAHRSDLDPSDPVTVAREVPLRLAPAAARGVARMREHGLLQRGDQGLGECLAHPAMRPVIALAVERALGGLDQFPEEAAVRLERKAARPWELAGITRNANLEAVAHRFVRYALAQGVALELDLARALIVGLRTKPFAVLAGLSGTGKTRVALSLARFFTEAAGGGAGRVAVVPVRPDWLDSRGLLGWLNALQGVWEDTEALRVLMHALEEPAEPHFIILDEMNLARAEHYLAEVLSAMESGAPIPLHGRSEALGTADGARRVPPGLRVAPNVFLLATVNVDDTTHPLSPKVIDRAWTWEFTPVVPSALARAWLGDRRASAPASADERAALLDPSSADDPMRAMVLAMGRDGVGQRVDGLYEVLAAHGRPFGFRVVTELLRFVQLCEREGIDTPPRWWLDHAVLGKVMPALNGPRAELEPLLEAMIPLLEGVERTVVRARTVAEELSPRRSEALARCAGKAREMLLRSASRSYVTFAR